jgi:RimJ/RimL family protein N-acetyltransferase
MTIQTFSTNRGTVAVRPACEADAERYRALRLQALHDHPQFFGSDYVSSAAHPLEYWQERMRRSAGDEHGITYLAEGDDALVGMTTLVCDADDPKDRHTGLIVGVYVAPAWRGLGIAGTLLEHCIAWAQQLALRQIKLAVTTSNTAAIRCYTRHGFRVYGIDPEAIGHGGRYYDELLMFKRL